MVMVRVTVRVKVRDRVVRVIFNGRIVLRVRAIYG